MYDCATVQLSRLREQYRPKRIRVLLLGESPPDPAGGPVRFFYAPQLSRHDNLFRGVAQAVLGNDVEVTCKTVVLEELQRRGFWLIDAVPFPVNGLKPESRKNHAIREALPQLIDTCKRLSPEFGIITCKTNVHQQTAEYLREAGIHVLNQYRLPFPLGNWRNTFILGFRDAMMAGGAGIMLTKE